MLTYRGVTPRRYLLVFRAYKKLLDKKMTLKLSFELVDAAGAVMQYAKKEETNGFTNLNRNRINKKKWYLYIIKIT